MNVRFLKARQTKYAAYVTLYVVIVLAVLVIANILGDRHNKSYDTTTNKRYSLSAQTAKIVQGIKRDVSITYFDQPTRFKQGKDVLDQYANLSPKIHVEYVDADKKRQVAREAGITNYGTAVIQIGDRKEQAKSLTEEGISGAFIRVLKNNARNICFVAGSGEHRIDDADRNGYSRLKSALDKDEYAARSISLLEKAEVPQDCTVVVVGGPTRDYLQPEVDALRKYVEGGGRALFMLDAPLKMGRSEIADNDALTGALQSWGVTMKKDLVLDLNPVGQLVGVGPDVALVKDYNAHPIVNEMKGMYTGLPISRSLEVKNTDKTAVEKLFDSSASSLATTNLSSPDINPKDPKNKRGPLTLAAAGSYKTGKENSQGLFIVIGSSAFATNSFITFNGNADLALNSMNWLASDEDLISIRPKDQDDRRITMTAAQFSWVRTITQFLLPLAVVFAAVMTWWKRR
ncbi:MAG TPA: GldG family protein [Candidatus Angelobacter sp.]|nr:GldG family protein [Candidatus Angelobacter sp.]